MDTQQSMVWTPEQPGDHTVSPDGTITFNHGTVLLSDLVLRRAAPITVSGWMSNPFTEGTKVFQTVDLLGVREGNYYLACGVANWVDDRNGIYRPSWMILQNEWQHASAWWIPAKPRVLRKAGDVHRFNFEWQPTAPDGSRGRGVYTVGSKTYASPELPMPADLRLAVWGGPGGVVGPLSVVGEVV